jgi:hypothetical protein
MGDLTPTCALGAAALQHRAAELVFAITPTAAPA